MLNDLEWLTLIWVDILFIPDQTLYSSIKEKIKKKKLKKSEPFQRLRKRSRPTCADVSFYCNPLQVGCKK